MKAIISGQAGIAVIIEADDIWSVTVESPGVFVRRTKLDILYLFQGTTDTVELHDVTRPQAVEKMKEAWRRDRALQLTLILLDKGDADLRVEAAECVNEHFADPLIQKFVTDRLHSAPLPAEADLDGARLYARRANAERVRELLEDLKSTTPPSREISRTLVRVVEIQELACSVVLPGFDGAREHIIVSRDQIPADIWDLFEPGKRCHARVNIGAERSEDLIFSDWERE